MPKSIITDDMEHCFICGASGPMHIHHVFYGTANRRNSDELGLVIPLCPRHHNMSNEGIHFDKELDDKVKRLAQTVYEETTGTREDFMRIFGRNYL